MKVLHFIQERHNILALKIVFLARLDGGGSAQISLFPNRRTAPSLVVHQICSRQILAFPNRRTATFLGGPPNLFQTNFGIPESSDRTLLGGPPNLFQTNFGIPTLLGGQHGSAKICVDRLLA